MRVLKFGAVWCPGCVVMRPRWQEIEKENDWLDTVYFDYDNDKEAVQKWQIDNKLPTFVFVDKNNKEIERISGEFTKKDLISLIEKYKNM